ncbi:hypothetical protein JW930_06555 [Candidatus Woesearchaeota archaeon]|nr:hypothetical protein [Candidatus Woesearchaeota archaeon]
MINKKDFNRIRKELEKTDTLREEIIIHSRRILKLSKQAIYALHRNQLAESDKYLNTASAIIEQLRTKISASPLDPSTNIFSSALQEYTEAKCYYCFLNEQRLPTSVELKIDFENYLLGICDLTGELERRAVHSVIKEDFSQVKIIHEMVQSIFQEFLKFDFRNSELRKKSDAIKWNLKRIESVLYDLKLRGKT